MPIGEPAKKIVLTCVTNPVGKALAQAFETASIPVAVISPNQIDWSDAALVNELFARQTPFLVINTLSLDTRYRSEHASFAEQIAKAGDEHGVRVIHFSDYHVFGGEPKNTYYETDKPAPLTEFGESLAAAEKSFIEHLGQHCILRMSWLLSVDMDSLLTRLLSQLEDEKATVELSEDYRGSPTWTSDVARVTVGMVKQMLTGAENWGVFHYCSGDKCSEWEFGTLIADYVTEIKRTEFHVKRVKDASQRLRSVPLAERSDDDNDMRHEPHSAVLSCRRIRNNFGIQPRTWRQGLKAQIRAWLLDNSAAANRGDHNKVDAAS